MCATEKLMDYFHTHSDATIRYFSSQMQLHIHSYALYLSVYKYRSRVGGHFFLSENFDPSSPIKHNGGVLVVAAILKNVVAYTAEAELGGLFINAKEGEVIKNMLEEMGHPQKPTSMHTYNSTATVIINETVKQHRSKATDMRFCWVRDRCKQEHFLVYWSLGKYNMGDYHTRFHTPSYQKKEMPMHLHIEAPQKYIL